MNECQAHVHTCPFDDMQECKACHEVKPLAEYYRSVTNRDGLVSKCKRCMAQSNQRKVISQASCVHACCSKLQPILCRGMSAIKAGDPEQSPAHLSKCICTIRDAEAPPCTAREHHVNLQFCVCAADQGSQQLLSQSQKLNTVYCMFLAEMLVSVAYSKPHVYISRQTLAPNQTACDVDDDDIWVEVCFWLCR